nr:fucose mutarotase isoform X3 [Camelus dromedarius]
MGHGDEIVLADVNFPTSSICRCGPEEIRADGLGIPQLLEAMLKLLPLDTYVEKPAVVMELVPSDRERGLQTPVWRSYQSILLGAGCAGDGPLRKPHPQEGGASPRRPVPGLLKTPLPREESGPLSPTVPLAACLVPSTVEAIGSPESRPFPAHDEPSGCLGGMRACCVRRGRFCGWAGLHRVAAAHWCVVRGCFQFFLTAAAHRTQRNIHSRDHCYLWM